jgi:hypothetical protein
MRDEGSLELEDKEIFRFKENKRIKAMYSQQPEAIRPETISTIQDETFVKTADDEVMSDMM